ncbi:DUF2062 domain-containing protein [Azoarcus sp. L1K30]|uniref:DUF2062 domain-containing protein n=1 Tax=Azoarcus sp. L1K30 TaxID=2820277 RepID=UPI001B8183E5|nr:DUF2062 domain-containing protein [Azoarcus sp. L1K30]MBR0568535.1 DUF2062 domain-containing protein [Azoarcus sp. L1K30]
MLKRLLPTHDSIKQSRLLSWLGPRIHDPLLWHVNRRAVARGVAIGAFFGLMVPVAQIPAAAVASLLLRGNLWIAAVSTLVSNPFTYAPIYYFAYRLGASLIGAPIPRNLVRLSEEAATPAWFGQLGDVWAWLTGIGQPLVLGMLLMAVCGATIGYWGARLFWRVKVLSKRRRQRQLRVLRTAR